MSTAFRPDFTLKVLHGGGERSIVAAGELDSASCASLLAAFEQTAEAGDPERVVLDMQGITFIDSAGMRAIIQIERAAKERSLALAVIPPPGEVSWPLELSGLADRVSFGPSGDGGPLVGYRDTVDLELPRDDTAPGRARVQLREVLRPPVAPQREDRARRQPSETEEVAVLLTSELVTNAVIHPTGPRDDIVALRIMAGEDRLRIEVADAGAGFDPARPQPREPDRGGRGLMLVDRLARRWGAGPGEGGRFTVWFELPAPGAGDGRPSA